MKAALYQKMDGTVYWLHEDGRWQYLSPLFAEWLDVFDQPEDGKLEVYPRNLNVPTYLLPDSEELRRELEERKAGQVGGGGK